MIFSFISAVYVNSKGHEYKRDRKRKRNESEEAMCTQYTWPKYTLTNTLNTSQINQQQQAWGKGMCVNTHIQTAVIKFSSNTLNTSQINQQQQA